MSCSLASYNVWSSSLWQRCTLWQWQTMMIYMYMLFFCLNAQSDLQAKVNDKKNQNKPVKMQLKTSIIKTQMRQRPEKRWLHSMVHLGNACWNKSVLTRWEKKASERAKQTSRGRSPRAKVLPLKNLYPASLPIVALFCFWEISEEGSVCSQ